jgi:hypothetical protein
MFDVRNPEADDVKLLTVLVAGGHAVKADYLIDCYDVPQLRLLMRHAVRLLAEVKSAE